MKDVLFKSWRFFFVWKHLMMHWYEVVHVSSGYVVLLLEALCVGAYEWARPCVTSSESFEKQCWWGGQTGGWGWVGSRADVTQHIDLCLAEVRAVAKEGFKYTGCPSKLKRNFSENRASCSKISNSIHICMCIYSCLQ